MACQMKTTDTLTNCILEDTIYLMDYLTDSSTDCSIDNNSTYSLDESINSDDCSEISSNFPNIASYESFIEYFNEKKSYHATCETDVYIRKMCLTLFIPIRTALKKRVIHKKYDLINTNNVFEFVKDKTHSNHLRLIAEGNKGTMDCGIGIRLYQFHYFDISLNMVIPVFWGNINQKFQEYDNQTRTNINSLLKSKSSVKYISDELYNNIYQKIQTRSDFLVFSDACKYIRAVGKFWNIKLHFIDKDIFVNSEQNKLNPNVKNDIIIQNPIINSNSEIKSRTMEFSLGELVEISLKKTLRKK